MVKSIYKEEINNLSFEDLISEVERNKRDLARRWVSGSTYGAGVRNTSKLEHRQVLCQDRLINKLLGPKWESNLDLVNYMIRWAESRRKEFEYLKNKIS